MLVMMEKVAIMADMLLHAFTPERDTSHFTNWSPVHCHIVHSQSQKTTVLHSLWFPSCPLPRYPVTVIFKQFEHSRILRRSTGDPNNALPLRKLQFQTIMKPADARLSLPEDCS